MEKLTDKKLKAKIIYSEKRINELNDMINSKKRFAGGRRDTWRWEIQILLKSIEDCKSNILNKT